MQPVLPSKGCGGDTPYRLCKGRNMLLPSPFLTFPMSVRGEVFKWVKSMRRWERKDPNPVLKGKGAGSLLSILIQGLLGSPGTAKIVMCCLRTVI